MACVPGHVKRKSEPGWWQHEATEAVLIHLLETSVRPRLTLAEQTLFRSQGGPMSDVPFTSFPTSLFSRFDSSVFWVLLQRRLWLPFPPSTHKCRCARLLDVRGHHRAACAVVGVLGRRGFPVESAAARVFREAGARVSTNVMVRDLDILPMVCPSSTGHNWRSIPPLCRRCEQMGLLAQAAMPMMAQPFGHNEDIPRTHGRSWASSTAGGGDRSRRALVKGN